MKKFLLSILFLPLFSCGIFMDAAKISDLQSPCAGCEDRAYPSGNLRYLNV